MSKTLIAIAAASALAATTPAWAWCGNTAINCEPAHGTDATAPAQDGFPTIDQDPNEYCVGHGGVVCIDWIQRDYDMAKLYWAEASPETQRKCAAQTTGGLASANPMNFYGLLHGCLRAWVEIEYSTRRPRTFHYSGD